MRRITKLDGDDRDQGVQSANQTAVSRLTRQVRLSLPSEATMENNRSASIGGDSLVLGVEKSDVDPLSVSLDPHPPAPVHWLDALTIWDQGLGVDTVLCGVSGPEVGRDVVKPVPINVIDHHGHFCGLNAIENSEDQTMHKLCCVEESDTLVPIVGINSRSATSVSPVPSIGCLLGPEIRRGPFSPTQSPIFEVEHECVFDIFEGYISRSMGHECSNNLSHAVPLGEAVRAVVMRLQGGLPRISVSQFNGGEDIEPGDL